MSKSQQTHPSSSSAAKMVGEGGAGMQYSKQIQSIDNNNVHPV
jgi:hypothetical protein